MWCFSIPVLAGAFISYLISIENGFLTGLIFGITAAVILTYICGVLCRKKTAILVGVVIGAAWGTLLIVFGEELEFVIGLINLLLGLFVMYSMESRSFTKTDSPEIQSIFARTSGGERLSFPCIVNLIRNKNFKGCLVSYKIQFNGVYVGRLYNGRTLYLKTDYRNNIISGEGFPDFEFQAKAEGFFNIRFDAGCPEGNDPISLSE